MSMEVVVSPVPEMNNTTCPSPYITAPSSPQKPSNLFFMAPASPVTKAPIASSKVPFQWEEKPGTPKNRQVNTKTGDDEKEDFAFHFNGQLTNSFPYSATDDIFDCGKIRSLKPPPGYDQAPSPRSSKSPKSRTLSRKEIDPFAVAFEQIQKTGETNRIEPKPEKRGSRGRTPVSSNYVHKGSRSLSPLRVAEMMLDQEDNSIKTEKPFTSETRNSKSYSSTILSAISFSSKGYKKWKLRDLLIFRNASEGAATSNNQLKMDAIPQKEETSEDVKDSSFRSTESSSSLSGSKRSVSISSHELHYTMNKVVLEDMKRKTLLPYKQGLLGCLWLNRSGVHEISRGIESTTRGEDSFSPTS